MITNKYSTTTTHPIVYIHGKRDKKVRSFWFSVEDEELVRQHIWNMNNKKYIVCTCHSILLHRLVMGAKKGQEVDHINRTPQDNMRQNLRIVTHAENLRNRVANKENSLPVKGVYWTGHSWSTEIVKNGYAFTKAGFDTLPEAICWKIRREYELYGDKSPNYRPILKKMPKHLLRIYFPEIYGNKATKFIGSPIFNAHYKNSQHKNWYRHIKGVRKAGVAM